MFMFNKPTKWRFLLKAFPIWQPVTDFWAKTTAWPVIGKYARTLHNKKRYDVTFIPINEELEHSESQVVPLQIISEMIQRSCHRVILKVCLCRVGCGCEHYPMNYGCLFMGESSKEIDPSMGRAVSVEEAEEYMHKCVAAGLIPQIGRVDADPFMLGIKPEKWERFITLCFCCPCCCIAMRNVNNFSPKIKNLMHGLEGLRIEVTENCNGCGKCASKCFTEAISLVDSRAVIDKDSCKGCGICASICPQKAIEIEVADGNIMLESFFTKIDSYVDIVSEGQPDKVTSP